MQALHAQLLYELQRFNVSTSNKIETVFIGGGTPSTVDPALYLPIFNTIAPFLCNDAEVTAEANPNSATYEWLEGMKNLGVNRLSFGVQSFDDTKLKTLGRAHNTHHALKAIHNASTLGFKHLSVDLIYGVLGDTQELLQSDIDTAISLPIDHISLYALTIEEHTAFEKSPHMSYEELELTEWIFDSVKTKGFKQYEISNFGSYQSAHNLGYWEGKNYMGVGAGAVGFLDNTRFYPSTDIDHYLQNPLEIRTEILTSEELLSEKIFLGFRSCVGVKKNILTPKQQKQADLLVDEKILTATNETYFNTNFLIADEIALRIEGF
jgi:oxygen-independent coproporphyrinogen-3 oxidase